MPDEFHRYEVKVSGRAHAILVVVRARNQAEAEAKARRIGEYFARSRLLHTPFEISSAT